MNGEILIFISRVLCYGSNVFFANNLAEAFEKIGYNVEMCELDFSEDMTSVLEKYVGKKFTAIIDFNSTLPRLEVDEKVRYLDMIEGPFFNYIVDHPLYHHPVLQIDIKDYNVICLDNNHKQYIEKYYQNIKNTLMLPLAPTSSVSDDSCSKKTEDIVFLGTYTPSRIIDEQIIKLDNKDSDLIEQIIDIMYYDSSISHEKALEMIFAEKAIELSSDEFKQLANKTYLADMYLRAIRREKVINELINNDIKVTVYGAKWDEFFGRKMENLIIRNNVDYAVIPEIMSRAKMVLNVMPEFKDGIHDRVLNAMQNRAVCITDTNDFISRNFVDGQDLITYSNNRLEELPEKIKNVLEDESRLNQIAQNGYRKVAGKYTWTNSARKILESIGRM